MSRVTENLVLALEESERWKKENAKILEQGPLGPKKTYGTKHYIKVRDAEYQTFALAKKMKERLIVNFIKQLILFGVDLIKESIRT